jgi:two-component system cell cycle response regulator
VWKEREMADRPLRRGKVLLVEDDELLCWSLRVFLEKRGFTVDFSLDGAEGRRMAAAGDYDLLLTDLRIRSVGGLGLARAALESNPHLQVIVITGHGSKEAAIEALRQGVWDFVEKPFNFELLLITIEKALDKGRMEKELVRLSRTDGLTGLYNQRHFTHLLDLEMKRASRQKRKVSLILVDVDHFKKYNDLHGHLGGDDLLRRLAGSLKKACRRDVDKAFRYGGDEFVILLPEADIAVARAVAGRIDLFLREDDIGVTLSIGLTELVAGSDLRDFIGEADEAMYLAKQLGGNRIVTFAGTRSPSPPLA